MTKAEMLKLVSSVYDARDPEFLTHCFDFNGDLIEEEVSQMGDGLAEFILYELTENWVDDGSDEDNLLQATELMEKAQREINSVQLVLYKEWAKLAEPTDSGRH